jgi:hypothetical protein
LVSGYANSAFELTGEEWTKLLSKYGFFPECTINAIPNEQLHNLVAIYELVKPDIVAMQEVVDFCHQWMKDPNRETLHDSEKRQLTVETISYGNVAAGERGAIFMEARLVIKRAFSVFFGDYFKDRSILRKEVGAIIGARNPE